jgi:hypothetical protein
MARLATGRQIGVAPNADLYLIKIKGQYRKRNGGIGTTSFNPLSMRWFLSAFTENIEARLPEHPGKKIVINMSWGKTQESLLLKLVSCRNPKLTSHRCQN